MQIRVLIFSLNMVTSIVATRIPRESDEKSSSGPRAHRLGRSDTLLIYDESQQNENINTGDKLVPSQGSSTGNPYRLEKRAALKIENQYIPESEKLEIMVNQEKIEDHPYMAFVIVDFHRKKVFCAGTIVTTLHILTSAKCIYDKLSDSWPKSSMVKIIIGTTYPLREGGISVEPYILYPNKEYLKTKHGNVAIIELKKPVTFSHVVRIIEMIKPMHDSLVREMVRLKVSTLVLGWGWDEDQSRIQQLETATGLDYDIKRLPESLRLLSHTVHFASFEECSDNVVPKFDEETQLCAKRRMAKTLRWCPGTRGGPVVTGGQMLAVVSEGTCRWKGRRHFVFTRLDNMRTFLDYNLYRSGRYKDSSSTRSVSYIQVLPSVLITFFRKYI